MVISISTKISIDFLKLFHKDPTPSFNNFAKMMDKSPVTIKNYYDKLTSSQLLQSENIVMDKILGTRVVSAVKAEIDHHKLDLSYVLLHLHSIYPYSKTMQILSVLENFPFVYKISKIKSPKFDLFILFAIPQDASNLVEEMANLMINSNICNNYKIYELSDLVTSKLDLSYWGDESNIWVLKGIDKTNDKMMFMTYLEQVFLKYYSKPTNTSKKKITHKSKKLDKLDFMLMRELEFNGRISLQNLVSSYNKDNSYLSRKAKHLRNNYIRSYNVNIRKNQFKLQNCILVGKAEKKVLNALISSINNSSFFFGNKFYTCNNREFYWEVEIPTIFVEDFLNFISSFCENVSYYQLEDQDIYYQKIDSQYFDFKSQNWLANTEPLFGHYTTSLMNRSLISTVYDPKNITNSNVSEYLNKFILKLEDLAKTDLEPLVTLLQSEEYLHQLLNSNKKKELISSLEGLDGRNLNLIHTWLNIILLSEDKESEISLVIRYLQNLLIK